MEEFLRGNGVAVAIIEKLTSEGYDWQTFKELDQGILRLLGFKGVEIQKLLPLVARAGCYAPQPNANAIVSKETEEDNSSRDRDDRLKIYFTTVEFRSLTDYEKCNNLALLERYERATEQGLNAVIIKPLFVKKWETRNMKKNKENKESNTTSTVPEQNRMSNRILNRISIFCNSTLPVPLQDQSNEQATSSFTSTGFNMFSQVQSRDGPSSSCSTGSSTVPSSAQSLTATESTSSDTPIRPEQPTAQATVVSFRMPIANFDCVKPSLPTYDVVKILEEKLESEGHKPSTALRNLKTEGFLRVKAERKLVIRTLTRYLYSLHSRNPSELTTQEKEGMAKSFVKAFPKYCGVLDDKNLPWDAIYCKEANTGWIVNASRSIQKSNRTRKSHKKTASDDVPGTDNDEYDSDEVQTLSLLIPGREEKAEIESGMRHSFHRRNASRKRNEPISFMLLEFPHLKSYDGEMLKLEFRMMRPNAQDMCRLVLGLQPKILTLPSRHAVVMDFVDDTIRALVILSQNLPHDVGSKAERDAHSGSWANHGDLFQAIGTNQDIDVFLAERRIALQRPIQLYLLGIKSVVTSKFTKFFIVLDNETVQLGQCQTIKAVDHLFMCYFIFNRSYPFGWRNTLHFLSTCFYKVFEDPVPRRRPDAVTPSERELWQLLANMQ